MDESTVEQLDETTDIQERNALKTPQDDVDDALVEAVLFAGDAPLPAAKIAAAAELPPRRVKQAVTRLNRRYEKGQNAFRIEEIAGGFQMMTLPEYHDVLGRLLHVKKDSRLSQAALETLAIIAYRQPILRADIESIRGVAGGEVLRGLLERGLVKIVGRAEVIGRPMLYGTSKRFLEIFGLASLDDLPRVEELRSGAESAPTGAAEPAGDANVETVLSEPDKEPPMIETVLDQHTPEPDEMEEDDEFITEEPDEIFEADDDDEEEDEDFDDEDFDEDDYDEDFDDDEDDDDEDEDDEDDDDEEEEDDDED
ncbi:MAG: SMC-Scp complex subunit ScpB [Phycisphaerae bacterium]|nr:SMC-Scp complex subunit ScpB [Phycisphaerae bacterium]